MSMWGKVKDLHKTRVFSSQRTNRLQQNTLVKYEVRLTLGISLCP